MDPDRRGASTLARVGLMTSQMRPAGAGTASKSALSATGSHAATFRHDFGEGMLHLQRDGWAVHLGNVG